MKKSKITAVLLALGMAITSMSAMVANAGGRRVSVHDPSVVKDGKTYYVFGSHIEAARSNDLINWDRFTNGYARTNNVEFGNLSENLKKAFNWAGEDLEDCKGGFAVWAPDVIWNPDFQCKDGTTGAYVMYFCTSSTYKRSVICYAWAKNIQGPYTFGDTLIYSGFYDNPEYDLVYNWDAVMNDAPGAALKIDGTDLLSGVSYYIVNKNSSMSLDLPEGKTDAGTNIQQWDQNGCFAQQFRIIAEDGGYCRIASVGDESKVVAVASNSADDGTNVELQTYTGADNQLFKLTAKDGYYGILSKCSGTKSSLDVFEWSTENGANIAQYPYNAFDCQLFTITPVHPQVNDGLYSFRRTSDGKVTGNRTVARNQDGKYTLTEADGKSGTYTIRCNADGSYTLIGSDNQEASYIFEPVTVKAPEPTEPPTTEPPATEPPATEPPVTEPPATEQQTPEKLRGDVDANGEVNVLDVVMLQKYLLGIGSLTDASQGDLNEDDVIDIFDLGLLKREVLRK